MKLKNVVKWNEKTFGRIVARKRNIPFIVDVFLDHSTYDKFRDYLAKNGFSESDALVNILERGMATYWLQEFKYLKQDYLPMKKLFEEYKKDNEVFKAIERQNEQLQKILEEKGQRQKLSMNR
jgi:hypothetical protein